MLLSLKNVDLIGNYNKLKPEIKADLSCIQQEQAEVTLGADLK